MEYLIIAIGSFGWVVALHYRKIVQDLRKEFIKMAILRDIDCSNQCSEEEYEKAKSEVLDRISEIRRELIDQKRNR